PAWGRRPGPALVHELPKLDLPAPSPWAVGAGNHQHRLLVQRLQANVLEALGFWRLKAKANLNGAVTQSHMEREPVRDDDVVDHAWILAREPIDYREHDPLGEACAAPDPDLTGRRIGEEFDVLHTLINLVERSDAASQQRATVVRRHHPLGAAVEQ